MLNIEELRKHNTTNDVEEKDLEIVNSVIEMLNQLDRSVPQVGDIVLLSNGDKIVRCQYMGCKTQHAGNLCQGGVYGSIQMSDDLSYYCDSTGGPWTESNPEEFKYRGTTSRLFWTWGRNGIGPNCGIRFPAIVPLWEVEIKGAYISDLSAL